MNIIHVDIVYTTDAKKFKSRAHLIPEFTGNKEVFYYNECDDCNNKFGLYETHLSAGK